MHFGAARDLLRPGASMPMIVNKGCQAKTNTVMRHLENTSLVQQDKDTKFFIA